MPSIGRRRLLAASAGGLTALAGCSTLGGDANTEPEPYRIGGVTLANYHDVPRQVDLLVQRDGDVVHWQTYELRAMGEKNGSAVVYGDRAPASAFGGCTPGLYDISLRSDDGGRKTFESASHAIEEDRDGYWREVKVGYYDNPFALSVVYDDGGCSRVTSETE